MTAAPSAVLTKLWCSGVARCPAHSPTADPVGSFGGGLTPTSLLVMMALSPEPSSATLGHFDSGPDDRAGMGQRRSVEVVPIAAVGSVRRPGRLTRPGGGPPGAPAPCTVNQHLGRHRHPAPGLRLARVVVDPGGETTVSSNNGSHRAAAQRARPGASSGQARPSSITVAASEDRRRVVGQS